MKRAKILKIIVIIIGVIAFIILSLYAYGYYAFKTSLIPNNDPFVHSSHYINPDEALLNDGFKICDENYIIQYYNPQRATYSKGKNGLRKFILSNYINNDYQDSGYLNFRFIINCKGEAGRYIIHENDLNLKPKSFNKDLVNQLFNLTTQLKKWNPNYTHDEYRDSHMYISYRIEHGEITEIIP